MKMLIIAPYFYPARTAASKRLTYITQKILQYFKNLKVDLIIYRNKPTVEILKKNAQNVKTFWMPSLLFYKKFITFFIAIFKIFIKIITNKYKVILISSPDFIPSYILIILSSFFKTTWLDMRDSAIELLPYFKGIKHWLWKVIILLEKFIVRNSSIKKITVTKTLADYLCQRYKCSQNTFYILPNGIGDEYYDASVKIKRKEYDVVFEGYIAPYRMPYKLMQLLKKTAEKIPSFKFLFISPPLEKYSNLRLLEFIKNNGLEKNIEFKELIPWPELPHMLKKCKLGLTLLPKFHIFKGAVGIKVFDYLGAELPVLCYADPSFHIELSKVVGNAGIFFKTPQEGARLICKILNNKTLYNRLKIHAKERKKELKFSNHIEDFFKNIKFIV